MDNKITTPSPIFSQPIDKGALTLSRSIALQESSKDGKTPNYTASGDAGTSYGAYQWNNGKKPLSPGQLPENFTSAAKEFGLNPNDFSPQNQDKVAYAQVLKMKQQGLQPEQIAAAWNAGMGHISDWQNHKGVTEVNGQQIQYDTPGYVNKVQKYYQQLAGATQPDQPQADGSVRSPYQSPQQTPESPSLGGFAKNTLQSGANFIGNLGEAVLHPIQTAQNLGSTALGGIEKLGGQDNENTQKFDQLGQFFKERYGGISNIEHSIYTDPIGVLADISAVLGIGGGLANAASKVGEVGGLTEASRVVGSVAKGLNRASELTNPLTPVIAGGAKALKSVAMEGAGNLIGKKGSTIKEILENPNDFTPAQIANTTRSTVAEEVETALNSKIDTLGETGAAYKPLRETPSGIKTTPDYLDNAIRDAAKVDIVDGVIKANSSSIVRDSADIKELQSIYNTYKPDFLNGTMDSNKFLNLREDLAQTANYNKGLTKNIQRVSADLRSSLNDTYRGQVKGLDLTDADYASQRAELQKLRKGFIDKDGNILESAVNKIANAAGKGKDLQLQRLEQIVPGVTRKIQILKTIEDIQKESPSFTSTLLKEGGLIGGISTGNIPLLAGTIATAILITPDRAIPILRAVGANQELIRAVVAKLAQMATVSTIESRSTSQEGNSQQLEQGQSPSDQSSVSTQPQQLSPTNQSLSSSNSTTPNFNVQGALAAGYTQKEIDDFLKTLH